MPHMVHAMSDNVIWESEEPHAIVRVDGAGPAVHNVWIHSDTFVRAKDAIEHAKNISKGHPLEMLLEWCYECKQAPPWIHDAAAKLLNRGSLAHGYHDDFVSGLDDRRQDNA